MRPSLALLVVLALVVLLGGCTLIDVRVAPHDGVHSHAFISGYVDAGWPASDSLIKVGLFKGPSRGSLLYFQIWKLFRFELGFVGLALGVGPFDAGVGVLLYHPKPPEYVSCDDESCEEEGDEHGEAERQHDDTDEPEDAKPADEGEAPFVYDAH